MSKSRILNSKHISLEFKGNTKFIFFVVFSKMDKSSSHAICHKKQIKADIKRIYEL